MNDRRLWSAGVAAVALLAGAAVLMRPTNHDVAWYLHMAGVMLDGGTAYIDAVDTNPPLILLLMLAPVWVARLIGAAPAQMFYASVFVAGVMSAVWCAGLIRRAWPAAPPAVHAALATGVAFLLLAFPKADFGQREHLTVIAVLPYVLMAAVRAMGGAIGRSEAVAGGIVGAIGFALKPHFLVAWLVIEATVVIRQGRRAVTRPECVSAMATFAAYAGLVLIVFPQYLDVARRVWAVYGGLDSSVSRLVALREWQIGIVALALLALLRLPRDLAASLSVLGAAAGGFLAASLLQLKGWGYHMLPAQVFLALFVLAVLTSLVQAVPALAAMMRGGLTAIVAAVAVILGALSVKYVYEARQPVPNDTLTPLVALVREHAPAGPIAVLGMRTLVYPAFPLVNETGARWSLRHHSLWFLPAFYAAELAAPGPVTSHRPADMPALEREFYEEILADLCAAPPRFLIIERAPPVAPAGRRALDLESYYGQDARFGRLFSAFRVQSDVGPFTTYKAVSPPSCQ